MYASTMGITVNIPRILDERTTNVTIHTYMWGREENLVKAATYQDHVNYALPGTQKASGCEIANKPGEIWS